MESWMLEAIQEYGYFGVLALILFENIFPPIPSELILTFSGFFLISSGLSAGWMIVAATTGSLLGAMILYSLGMLVDVPRLERLTDKYGKVFRLTNADIRKVDSWFNKYGPWAVLICRVVPLMRSLISIPAGMAHMNFLVFIVLTTIGSLIWNSMLITLGIQLGAHWEVVLYYMDTYSTMVFLLLIAAFFFFFFRRIVFYRK